MSNTGFWARNKKFFYMIFLLIFCFCFCYVLSIIAQKIKEVNTNEDIPVFLYGVYHPRFAGNYIKGEVCGYSSFEWVSGTDLTDSTSRGIDFMKTQGYNFSPVKLEDTQLIEKARSIGETMSDFPATDSVKNEGDVVVVRLSESSYKDKNSERQE